MARKELLGSIQNRYQKSSYLEKKNLLDNFIEATGYNRKHAIKLLKQSIVRLRKKKVTHSRASKYNPEVRQALITTWYAANQICSKRLVPFLPDLVEALERNKHLSLPEEVRSCLLSLSPATADRLLTEERTSKGKGTCMTRPGNLLKRQIPVRTFADWNEVVPGFFEGDLVAHCGGHIDGSFLWTLVLTDIASSWTECIPLLRRSGADVEAGLKSAQSLLPFSLLGLDTDNGGEFINHEIIKFCSAHKITFTRARAYKKNDQAHVEERNGSIVRRLIGYDRFEGLEAWQALAALYAVLRLYVNFFQPSLKLTSKIREHAKVTKKYDKAQTPHQRLMASPAITDETKRKLSQQYRQLDPIKLLKQLEDLQDQFWQHAWKADTVMPIAAPVLSTVAAQTTLDREPSPNELKPALSQMVSSRPDNVERKTIRRYRRTPKKQKLPRTWRTRKDPFESDWNQLRLQLELHPHINAIALLKGLIQEKPNQFKLKHLRTLQRRVAIWRKQQMDLDASQQPIFFAEGAGSHFTALAKLAENC